MDLRQFVACMGDALAHVDRYGATHKDFRPGIGPYGEGPAVRESLAYLKRTHPGFAQACTKRTPDLLLPGEWAVEFKLLRPFGDNGVAAEHWSENALHPYPGNVSSIGDCLKLLGSGLPERKAIAIVAYEHTPPQLDVETCVRSFELIATRVVGIRLGPRATATRARLRHPVHQQLRVFAWEVLGRGKPPP